ncbi:MAG: transcription-repair coupling factor [candidate division WOR-3 bacterium]|nr:MAG: transcription-repair coupling factor [candidate division WOR-3 bacterium]
MRKSNIEPHTGKKSGKRENGVHAGGITFFPAEQLIDELTRRKSLAIGGLRGSLATLLVYELSRLQPVIVLPNDENINRYHRELRKLGILVTLINEDHPYFLESRVIVAAQSVLSTRIAEEDVVRLSVGQEIALQQFVARLEASGYSREDNVEDENEYAARGGIIDFFESGGVPIRLEMYGDKIFSIRKFDTQTQRSTDSIDRTHVTIVNACSSPRPLTEWLAERYVTVSESELQELNRSVILSERGDIQYHFSSPRRYFGDLRSLIADMKDTDYSFKFLVSPSLARKLRSLLGEVEIHQIPVELGFVDEHHRIAYLTESEIFGTVRKQKRAYKGPFVDDLMGLAENDYVVHYDYGIGQYKGLTLVDFEGKSIECLQIAYAGKDRLFLPIERLNLLERFIASDQRPPRLSKLGGELWLRTKRRVRKATERLALELLKLYARRMQEPGFAFSPDSSEMKALEGSFPYVETKDQLKAINDLKREMELPKPAERLICGDVGYGKTEIALRASFKAALDGKQTMILCPTTLLAFQHYNTFMNRLDAFPVHVEMVSRFRKKDEIARALEGVSAGKIDIVIGTHRLLQPDVRFRDLGLLIIDEEQRFGVAQKEKITKMKPGVDVVYLSATPIPRTLYMALTGLKNVSNIHTPPIGRKDVITHIIHSDEETFEEIIRRELQRGGQIFFVHNRIQTIETVYRRLNRIMPDLRVCLLHGRVREDISARRMVKFINGEYDLLLSTAIIESGLDIPRVNTIIIDQAHKFGLADLHQLRGRVGRGELQGYAYFIVPPRARITDEANKRLGALVSYTSLGSGFRLALRDMEIRGVGNLLGREQSGHMNSIGYHHYIRLLNESVNELQGRTVTHEPVLDLKLDAYFPSTYVTSTYERTALYKRLLEIESARELKTIKEEILDRFGRYPPEVENLFVLSNIRLEAKTVGASEVIRKGRQFVFYRDGKVIHQTD